MLTKNQGFKRDLKTLAVNFFIDFLVFIFFLIEFEL